MTSKLKEFKGSLNAIFDATNSAEEVDIKEGITSNAKISSIPINKIIARNDQPRKNFDSNKLYELAQSIKTKGIIQPIVLRKSKNNLYEVIVGERRWRASKIAGLVEMPAIIKEYNEIDTIAISLIENIQRENLNAIEEANALVQLTEKHHLTHQHVSEILGKSRTAISNLIRLLSLEDEVKDLVKNDKLDMGHARALLGLSGEKQVNIAKLVVERNYNVRQTEQLVQQQSHEKVPLPEKIDSEFMAKIADWENRFAQKISSKVKLKINPAGKGKLELHFDTRGEAEWLMSHIVAKE